MTVATFGVTADKVRAHHFPHIPAFDTNSSPSAATVLEKIYEKAAELQGRLLKESVSAAGVEALGATAGPYLWCRETLKLMVAVEVGRDMTGADPALVKAWESRLALRLKRLEADSATELGDDSLTTTPSDPDGPTSHISELGLDVGDTSEASDVVPVFRRKDRL